MKLYKSILLISTFLISAFFANLSAQWYWTYPKPMGLAVYGTESISPDIFLAVGASGALIKSTDAGNTWKQQSVYLNSRLLDIVFLDENNGYAMAHEYSSDPLPGDGQLLILKTSDGGKSWFKSFWGGDISSAGIGPHGISFIDQNHGAIVKGEGVYSTTNGGADWNFVLVGSSSNSSYNDIVFVNKDICFLVGYGGSILKSTDGGLTWFNQVTPTNKHLQKMFFQDSSTGFIVGAGGTILRTTDGGIIWNIQNSGVDTDLYSIFANKDRKGNAVITAVGDEGIILRSTDNGSTWINQISTPGSPLYTLTFSNPEYGIAAGESSIIRTSDGGITWNPVNENYDFGTFNSVDFEDKETGTVVGRSGVILRTTDGGNFWQIQKSGTTKNLTDVSFVNKKVGYVCGEGGLILKTSDGGENWFDCLNLDEMQNINFKTIYFTDEFNGYAGGTNGFLFRTTDGGDIWTFTRIDLGYIHDIFFLGQKGWLTGTLRGRGWIYKTTDGGEKWATTQSEGSYMTLQKFYFIDQNNGFFIQSEWQGYCSRTTDGGRTWTGVNLGSHPQYLHDISFSDLNNGVIIGYGCNSCDKGVFYRTSDGGVTWNVEYSNKIIYPRAVSFAGGSANVVGGGGGGGFILRSDNPLITSIEENSPVEFTLFQNYPNPFNPSTTIKYSLPQTGRVTLSIYDLLGREIVKLVDEEKPVGEYETKWNASTYPSGVYFLRMQAGQYSETRKLLLMK
jgi:photosystem II stability/assembly factor-like uncharacterized protein